MTSDKETPLKDLRALYRMMSRPRRKDLLLLLAVMLLAAAAEVAIIGSTVPFLLLALTPDRAPPLPWPTAPGGSSLIAAAMLLSGAAIVAALVRLLLAGMSQSFALKLGHELGTTMFSRMLRQPYGYYVARNTSELLVGMEKVQTVVHGLLLPVVQGVSGGVLALCVAALLFLLNPYAAALVAPTLAAVYFAISVVTRRRLKSNSAIVSQSSTARMKLVREGLGGIRDILLDRSQAMFEDAFREIDARYRRGQATNMLISTAPRHVVECAALVLVAFVAVAVSYRQEGMVDALPVLGAFVLGAQRLMPFLQQVYFGFTQYAGNLHALRDLLALLRAPVVPVLPQSAATPLPFAQDVLLRDVSFSYAHGTDVIRGVTLRIPRGARVGIVGRSGGGKSTLLDLLMGLLEPTAGEILVDGVPIDEATRPRWQAQIAHVPQAIYLADRSVAENIAFGEPEERIDTARMESAARQAEVYDFITGLPDGFGTRVGERGVQLSGGQRQRIGIARALYKRADLLILDEVTSALDEVTEAAVIRSLSALESEKTVVIVTHRLSNLDTCDLVIRLDGGRVVQAGAPAALPSGAVS